MHSARHSVAGAVLGEKGLALVKNGHGVNLAETPQTKGHGTHTMAWIWKGYLEDLLRETAK